MENNNENKKPYLALMFITTAVCFMPMLFGLAAWNNLPESMVVHFNFNNEPDNFAPKWVTVFILPALMAAMNILYHLLIEKSAKGQKMPAGLKLVLKWLAPVLCIVVSALVYAYTLGNFINISGILIPVVGLVFAAIGNYIPKVNSSAINLTGLDKSDSEGITKAKRVVGILFVAAGVLNFACGFFYFGRFVFMASLPVLLLGSVFAPFFLVKRSSRK